MESDKEDISSIDTETRSEKLDFSNFLEEDGIKTASTDHLL